MPLYKAVDVSSLPDAASIGWTDVDLFREAANVIAQRQGTNPQVYRLYNTYTDGSNYERGFFRWSANALEIGMEAAGTGGTRNTHFAGSGSFLFWQPLYINSSIFVSTHVVWGADASYDIGSQSARARSLYLSGGVVAGTVTKTANYTATANDFTIRCDATSGAVTITLPAAASHTGRLYRIKKVDSSANAVTIDGNAAETIDGAATQSTTTQYASWTIQSNGTNWDIV